LTALQAYRAAGAGSKPKTGMIQSRLGLIMAALGQVAGDQCKKRIDPCSIEVGLSRAFTANQPAIKSARQRSGISWGD
jgi:hypothetical protein